MTIETPTLDRIVARVRSRLAERRAATLAAPEPLPRRTEPRGFRRSLLGSGRHIVAEFKRRSPSKGVIRADVAPGVMAKRYEAGGATALSVLTEPDFFDGSLSDLLEARAATMLPVLRKDFIVDESQIEEAWLAGADAILLIAAALDPASLARLRATAAGFGLDVLVEVHDGAELDRALGAGADLVGVNNRDLRTMEVRLQTGLALGPRIPRGVVAVAESGIESAADIARLADAGFGAFLVGETLMRADDPAKALKELLGLAENA
jgi:indole-3-glycerol phosphate synthase